VIIIVRWKKPLLPCLPSEVLTKDGAYNNSIRKYCYHPPAKADVLASAGRPIVRVNGERPLLPPIKNSHTRWRFLIGGTQAF